MAPKIRMNPNLAKARPNILPSPRFDVWLSLGAKSILSQAGEDVNSDEQIHRALFLLWGRVEREEGISPQSPQRTQRNKRVSVLSVLSVVKTRDRRRARVGGKRRVYLTTEPTENPEK
jgi:hypothetical protein